MSQKNPSQDEIELGIEIEVPTQPSQTLKGSGKPRSQKSTETPGNPPPRDPMLTDSEDSDPILKAEKAGLTKADSPPTPTPPEPAEKPLPANPKAVAVIDSIAGFHTTWQQYQHVIPSPPINAT